MADGTTTREVKDLYAVGEIPPDFHVPKNMHAWAIRRERQGRPKQAMQLEVVPTPEIASDEVLVLVMAAGVNYNGIWAGLGEPVSMFDVHKQPYHVAGSDASGIVWAVGDRVKRWKPGLCSGVVKKNTHKALDDIRESIEELKYYREHFFIK